MQKVHGDSLYNFIKKLHASDASMAVKEKAAKKIAFDLTLALGSYLVYFPLFVSTDVIKLISL